MLRVQRKKVMELSEQLIVSYYDWQLIESALVNVLSAQEKPRLDLPRFIQTILLHFYYVNQSL